MNLRGLVPPFHGEIHHKNEVKTMSKFLSLTFIAVFSIVTAASNAAGQCVDFLDVRNADLSTVVRIEPIPTPKPSPEKPDEPERGIVTKLPEKATFKIALKASLTSAFNKHNDFVLFEVLDDVYTYEESPDVPKQDPKAPLMRMKRCTVIPKGTPVYGLVDRSKSKRFLGIGGKSQLKVYVRDILAPGARETIKIKFIDPSDTDHNKDLREKKPVTVPCETALDRDVSCIYGRRTDLSLIAPSKSVLASVGTKYYDARLGEHPLARSDARWLAGFAGFDALLTGSILVDLLKSKDAILQPNMIFEVQTREDLVVWASLKAPEPKKDKGGEDDKK